MKARINLRKWQKKWYETGGFRSEQSHWTKWRGFGHVNHTTCSVVENFGCRAPISGKQQYLLRSVTKYFCASDLMEIHRKPTWVACGTWAYCAPEIIEKQTLPCSVFFYFFTKQKNHPKIFAPSRGRFYRIFAPKFFAPFGGDFNDFGSVLNQNAFEINHFCAAQAKILGILRLKNDFSFIFRWIFWKFPKFSEFFSRDYFFKFSRNKKLKKMF